MTLHPSRTLTCLFLALALVFSSACGSSAKPAVTSLPAVAATGTIIPTPRASLAPAPTIAPDLQKRLATIEDRVTALRGLKVSAVKQRQVVSRFQLGEILKGENEMDIAQVKISQMLLRFLGLIGPNDDLLKLRNDQLNQQVLGLFEPKSGNLYVVSDSATFSVLDESTYSHEYTHSLQQGAFDIQGAQEKVKDDSEASSAYTALVEGDAVLTQTLYAQKYIDLRELSRQESQAGGGGDILTVYPKFLQDSLFFPYVQGVRFVQYLYQKGGFDAVNKALRNPPVSTGQIMHPEKYDAGLAPKAVTLPDLRTLLDQGWTKLTSDSFGEFDLMEYLALHGSSSTAAAQAAAGWNGDRFAFLQGPTGQLLLVDMLQWETPADAQEFMAAIVAGITPQGSAGKAGASKAAGPIGGQHGYVSVQGASTLFVLASDASAVDPVKALFPGF